MSNNPYSAPDSHLVDMTPKKSGPAWHTTALMWLLTAWGIWSFSMTVLALSEASSTFLARFGLIDYFSFFSISCAMLGAAFLLSRNSRHAVVPMGLLPALYVLLAIRLNPVALNPANRQWDASYFMQFPLAYRLGMLFFALLTMYCLFLRKHKKLV